MATKKDRLTEEIEAQEKITQIESAKLQDLVAQKEKKDLVPLARSFRDRCFMYRNSSGGADRWWLYLKVIKTRGTIMHCITFEKTSYKEITFKTEMKKFVWRDIEPFSDYIAITKEEFEEARKELLQSIKTLGKDI